MNGLSSWSIRHPVPTIVLFLVLAVAGLVGFTQLRTNNMPDIDQPSVTVTVTQAGAAPSELETQVTRLVEDAVAGLGNVDHISSSVTEGSSVTTIQFDLSVDVDRATNDVRNAVSSIESSLPAAVETPIIQRVDTTDNAIVTFVVAAPAMSPDALSWFVDNDIAKSVLGVKGVSKIERAGGVDREIRVKLDPQRLSALGVTAGDISQALANANINEPGGRTTIGGREQTVRTLGSVTSVEALADSRVPLNNGQSMRLADLGSVEDTWAEPRQRARLDGQEVVAFSVYRSVGSSEVDVVAAVRAQVQALQAARGDIKIQEVTSSSDFVVESYDAALEALWIGALLAVGVVWLFLRDWRATLISSVALPLSLLPTFAVMALFDLSLNTLTLLALSLVVGILVDDAIVEVENIVRHIRQSGKGAYRAAIEAADEIGLAVVATTGTIVAVFLPVAFMPGIPGQLFKSFAIATCVSVLFSLLVARMLTPLMSAYLLKSHGGEKTEAPSRFLPTYLWLLRGALRHRWITLGAGVAFFAGSLLLATLLPTDFMTATDRGRSLLSVELPPGSTLDDTDRVVLAITERLKDQPAVAGIFASEGTTTSSGVGSGSSSSDEVRTATVTVNLVPRDQRDLSQQAFETQASLLLRDIPGARISFGADGQSGAKISITLAGDDGEALSRASEALLSQMRGIPGLLNPTSTASLSRPEIIVTPDSAKAAEAGVTARDIAETVYVATLGDSDQSLAKFNLTDRQISIRVSLQDEARNDPALIGLLPVEGRNATVPLDSVASIAFGSGPTSIERIDRHRQATVEAELQGLTLGQAAAAIAQLPIMQDLPAGVSQVNQGDLQQMQELFSGFALAMAAGIGLIYATLVLLFVGFVQPATILTSLPLSVGGALGFLVLTGHSLAVSALIGLLMLMGIAAKNSILLVEYALLAQRRGLDRTQALLDAAAKRARPIVMTSIAMAAGMAPIALGFGADAESRAPMAIAVIGGLLSSTLLSLVFVPVFYTFMDDLQRFAGRILGRLLPNREAGKTAESPRA